MNNIHDKDEPGYYRRIVLIDIVIDLVRESIALKEKPRVGDSYWSRFHKIMDIVKELDQGN